MRQGAGYGLERWGVSAIGKGVFARHEVIFFSVELDCLFGCVAIVKVPAKPIIVPARKFDTERILLDHVAI
jgi:hypothetical protein